MKTRYELLLILDTKGKEEAAKDTIDRLEKDIAKEGVTVERVERTGRQSFAYPAKKMEGGYYAAFYVQAEPAQVAKLREKFRLDSAIYRQYLHLAKADRKPAEAAA